VRVGNNNGNFRLRNSWRKNVITEYIDTLSKKEKAEYYRIRMFIEDGGIGALLL